MESEGGNGKQLIPGGSLPVENVQDLAAAAASKNLNEIPTRYIRPEKETDPVLDADGDDEIPIIDLSKLVDPHQAEEEAAKLAFACEEWGFFQLISHGVAAEVIDKLKCDIEGFFQLPLDEKAAFAQLPGNVEGYGQAFVFSEDQKLDWADGLFLVAEPKTYRNMKFWPTKPPSFRDTLDEYLMEVKRITDCLLSTMTKSLGLTQMKLTDMFSEVMQLVRINYYPPCPQADKVLGLSPHSDATGLTLLLQVNQVQGLQIKRNSGWMPIKPLPYAFIVNIGDILEIMSNGKYKSIEHRAIINTEKERLSISVFHNPKMDVVIGPLPELAESGQNYKTMSHENYIKLEVATKLDGKSFLNQMKLK